MDQFLADVLPRQIEAEEAICNGNPAPQLAMWSSKNPLILFGASFRGGEVAPISARVTHVYRRENGEWMIIHRHADRVFGHLGLIFVAINACVGTNTTALI